MRTTADRAGEASHAGRRSGSGADRLRELRVERTVVILRWVFLAHAALMAVPRWPATAHKGALVAVMAVMAAWTGVITWQSRRPHGRRRLMATCDLALTLGVVLVSRVVLGPEIPTAGFEGVGYYWVLCAPAAVALTAGSAAGALAALVIIAPGPVGVGHHHLWAWSADLLLLAGCWALGRVMSQMRQVMAENQRAHEAAAVLAERDRLSRVVHDGVLQVLTMVEREGPDLGPRGAALAGLAHDQGTRLRRMLQTPRSAPTADEGQDAATKDLVDVVGRHESESVTVSAMAGGLEMPAHVVDEIDAALAQVLANVQQHAGDGAHCWILIEQEGDAVVVSARDNGVGMSPEESEHAGTRGRMGISRSIIGRVHDIGGTSEMRSAPGRGVEWEFRIPGLGTGAPG